eukprot:scaffold24089_cov66-Phaeocystis_antarctica.AAC.1
MAILTMALLTMALPRGRVTGVTALLTMAILRLYLLWRFHERTPHSLTGPADYRSLLYLLLRTYDALVTPRAPTGPGDHPTHTPDPNVTGPGDHMGLQEEPACGSHVGRGRHRRRRW